MYRVYLDTMDKWGGHRLAKSIQEIKRGKDKGKYVIVIKNGLKWKRLKIKKFRIIGEI